MKLVIALLLVIHTTVFANTEKEELEIQQEGQVVTIVDFEEGDQIKVFETATGVHILSKQRGQIDLSQLPEGSYTIIDNNGRTIEVINNSEEIITNTLSISTEVIEDAPLLEQEEIIEAEVIDNNTSESTNISAFNSLEVLQEGNHITIVDFEEGDKIKVFEYKDNIHVLTKKVDTVDLSQLPSGKYLIENSKNQIALVEKIEE